MKFYLDTGNLEEVEKAATLGIISGVTTNPTLLASTPEVKTVIQAMAARINGPISVETTVRDAAGMIQQGQTFATWHSNVVVKLPCTKEGFAACAALSRQQIRVNMTLCFTLNQALFAAAAGAFLVSPFVGRLEDLASDGLALIEKIASVFAQHHIETQILAASLRTPQHITEVALAGADIATCPWPVLEKAFYHPLTEAGLEKFLQDGAKITF